MHPSRDLKQSGNIRQTFGLRYPLIQGPFGGGLSSVELLAAVSDLGGLGSFGAHYLSPEQISHLIKEIRAQTKNPYAINLWVSDSDPDTNHLSQTQFDHFVQILSPYFEKLKVPKPAFPEKFGQKFSEQVEVILKEKPPVFSFVFGVPDEGILKECRKLGIKTIGSATTVEEGLALEKAGVDAVVASGFESGGHRGSFLRSAESSLTGIFALLPQMADALQIPVIAAGGIADVRGVRAAMTLGAQGVQVGTAFLACDESMASKIHKEKLRSHGKAGPTALTRAFSGRLARGLENQLVRDFAGRVKDIAPYPVQVWLTRQFKDAAVASGDTDLMALWASQAYPLIRHHKAADVFQSLLAGFSQ